MMLDALLQNPILTIAFFLIVLWLLGTYYVNKERSATRRKRGQRRFHPDWDRRREGAPDRRRPFSRRGRTFQPQWKRRPPGGGRLGAGDDDGESGPSPEPGHE